MADPTIAMMTRGSSIARLSSHINTHVCNSHSPSIHPILQQHHMSGICYSIIKLIALRNLPTAIVCSRGNRLLRSYGLICKAKLSELFSFSRIFTTIRNYVCSSMCHTLLFSASTIRSHTISRVNKSSTGQKLCFSHNWLKK